MVPSPATRPVGRRTRDEMGATDSRAGSSLFVPESALPPAAVRERLRLGRPRGSRWSAETARAARHIALVRALTANPALSIRLLNTGSPQLDREGPEPETGGEVQPGACIEAGIPAVAVAVAQLPERRSSTSAPDESPAGARRVAVVSGALPPPVGASISPAPPIQ